MKLVMLQVSFDVMSGQLCVSNVLDSNEHICMWMFASRDSVS
jgi:hypothetical protein